MCRGITASSSPHPEIDPETLKVRTFNSYILDVEGNVLAELKQEENRVWIDYAEIPKNLINCYVALEDKRFFEHEGIDYNRIGAALISYLKSMVDPSTDIQAAPPSTSSSSRTSRGTRRPPSSASCRSNGRPSSSKRG